MSFAFPDIDPNTSGTVTHVQVPLDRYLSESFAAGQHDTVLNSLSRISEFNVADDDLTSPILDTETANKKWGVGNLKFTEPVRESVARVMNRRKRDEMDREFFLSQGSSMGRFLPGMAASILGSVSNPLDLGLMFIPFVGEEAAAAKATSAVGRIAARRLITREALKEVFPAAPKLTESVINGMVGQSLFEVPNIVASAQDQANYGPKQAAFNVFAGGAFAATMHGLGAAMAKLGRGTREEMAKQALNQMLRDETIKVHQYVNVDEHAIWEKIRFDEGDATARAYSAIDYGQISKDIHTKSGPKVNPDTPAAWIAKDGSIEVDYAHWSDKMNAFVEKHGEDNVERAYHLTDGRVITEAKMSEMTGVPMSELSSEYLVHGIENNMTPTEESWFGQMLEEGMTRGAAAREILNLREEKARTNFFKDPAEKAKLDAEYKRQIDEFVAKERLKHEQTKKSRFDTVKQAEIDRQIAEGKILKDEEIQKSIPSEKFDGSADADLDFDINGLKQDLKLEEMGVKPDNSGFKSEEDAIKAAIDCILKKVI